MCPNCGEALIVLEFEGIEVDHCLACGGTWLDAGELEWITERAGTEPGRLTEALKEAKGRKAKRRCPRCLRKMEEISVGDSSPVELDRCPNGDGLWFDRGEILKVIEGCEEGEAGLVSRFFAESFRSELNLDEKGD